MSNALRGLCRNLHLACRIGSIGDSQGFGKAKFTFVPIAARALISTSSPKPQSNPSEPSFPSWTSNSPSFSIPPSATSKLPPRLGPTAGRSIAVRGGDVGGALMQLRRICSENSIARDAATQRFHERPGLKKKRLRRERFRRRFKYSFKKMVTTVLEMKRQGI
ncbi:hypothetical protein ABW20_dc0101445 [Dactylellina cionopaga]|nr:hypothetical protein ABW20_dc0101445 [Dactylellina cionopaga]